MYQRRRDTRAPQSSDHDFFISVSDLMSGLIFIFIITLLIFAFDLDSSTRRLTKAQEEKLPKLEAGIIELREITTNLKQNIDGYISKTADLQLQLLTDIQKDLEVREKLKVAIEPKQGILRVPNEILFPFGSSDLSPEGEPVLQKLARVFERHLPCYAGTVDTSVRPAFCSDRQWNPGTLNAIFIEGHTDSALLGPKNPHKNNLHLSGMRAIKTFEALLTRSDDLNSTPLGQLRNQGGQPIFGISGYGKHRPVVEHLLPTPEPANRRIDIRFFLVNPQPPASIPQILGDLDRLGEKLDRLKE
jgi:chemotaxis protein MotB